MLFRAKKVLHFLCLVFFVSVLLPNPVSAGLFSVFGKDAEAASFSGKSVNSQRMPLLETKRVVDLELSKGGGDITIIGGTALMPESGPEGTIVDVSGHRNGEISTYVVRKGDTIQAIAKMFDVTSSTIIWANDIKNSTIREGDRLVILPISGVQHTVKKGDTIDSIAKKYKADSYDISRYNDKDISGVLAIGEVILVPDGELAILQKTTVTTTNKLRGIGGPSYDGYYLKPVITGSKSQGLHGYNGVDMATYTGAPIFASAEGEVIVSMKTGWNGGYGKYIVISHPNGTQTLYAHNIENYVNVGDKVVRGQIIGAVGSTGKSTGPHLHFEVRGAKNPF